MIKKIELRKKHKVQLVSELDGIKDLFKGWQQRMRALHLHSDIMASANFLNQLVQQSFYSILTALQAVRQTGIQNVEINYQKEF